MKAMLYAGQPLRNELEKVKKGLFSIEEAGESR